MQAACWILLAGAVAAVPVSAAALGAGTMTVPGLTLVLDERASLLPDHMPGTVGHDAAAVGLIPFVAIAPGATSETTSETVPALAAPLTDDELADWRGGANLGQVNNHNLLNGSVATNTAANLITGSNSVADGSFANASGLPVVIQNSGNNVLIQNSIIVNVGLQ